MKFTAILLVMMRPGRFRSDGAISARAKRMAARKRKRKPVRERKDITARKPLKTTARYIELYSSAYRIAWKQISALRKREQPDIALRLHASIRSQLQRGATDPLLIATEAFKALNKQTKPGKPKPQES